MMEKSTQKQMSASTVNIEELYSMTHEELLYMIYSIDRKNAEYILADYDIKQQFENINRWEQKDRICMAVLDNEDNPDERCIRIIAMLRKELEDDIRAFDERHLTPANAKVGDGATVNLYTDRHAGTIVKVTKSKIAIRRDKAILSPDFKPEWIPGGFAAHCTNQSDQKYTYEPDENGQVTVIYWSKKYNRYGQPGNLTASKGRHEFYDYNF